jgi:pilus assembly protein FimV
MPLLFVILLAVLVNFPSDVLAQEKMTKIRGPRSSDMPPAPLTMGPLSPSDTLWRVAEQVKPDANVSLYQVMYALYLKNPDAFLENNLNHLRPNAVLILPSLQEVQQVDLNTARQKSVQDDKAWAARQKAAAAVKTATAAVKASVPVTAAAPVKTEPQWQAELAQLGKQQKQELDGLRTQFADSLQQIESFADENRQLRTNLLKIEQELALIKAQLGDDSKMQQQIEQLLSQQSELLQAQAVQNEAAAQAEQSDWRQWMSHPLAWILAACIPALLVLFSILLWVKNRSRHTEEIIHAATTESASHPTYHSPLPPLDDSNDLDESLFEIDDALLDETFTDKIDTTEPDLADDMLDFDDSLSFEDDSLLPSESPVEKPQEPEPEDAFDMDNILSDTDLSALLAAEEDDDAIIELADDSLDDEELTDVKTEPEAVSSEEINDDTLAQEDEFDIDELIEEIDLDEPDQPVIPVATSLQERHLTQSLAIPEALTENNASVTEPDLQPDLGRFDSSELDEFAESLAAENDGNRVLFTEQDENSDEALLSAELSALLDQVADDAVVSLPVNTEHDSKPAIGDSIKLVDDGQDDILLADEQEPETNEQTFDLFDLSAADDESVVRPTDAALSVENPSKMLEQYPELELTEDDMHPDNASELLDMPELDADLLLQDLDDYGTENDDNIEGKSEPEPDPMPDAQFDSLMSELEAMTNNPEVDEQPEQPDTPRASQQSAAGSSATDYDFSDDDFVEIDSLLANAQQQEQDTDRFNQLNVDVGLEDYADIIGEHERRDVDSEDNGYSAKLDLVRAYIEIDDRESADLLLDNILASDAPQHVKTEAQSLRQ